MTEGSVKDGRRGATSRAKWTSPRYRPTALVRETLTLGMMSLTKERYSGGLGAVQQSSIRREVVVAIEHALHFCADLLILGCQELRRIRQPYILD